MSVTFPEAVSALGRKKVVVLTSAPASPAAVTTTELAAGVETTMYFLGNFAPTGSQNKGNAPRRTGERGQLQRLGLATYEAPTLQYLHDPQGDTSDTANAAAKALDPDTNDEVWIVERAGFDSEQTFAANDRYRLHHLELGEQFFAPSGDDEFAIEQVTQETGYLTKPVAGVVAAGA